MVTVITVEKPIVDAECFAAPERVTEYSPAATILVLATAKAMDAAPGVGVATMTMAAAAVIAMRPEGYVVAARAVAKVKAKAAKEMMSTCKI